MSIEKKWWESPASILYADYIPSFLTIRDADLEALARSRKEQGIDCEWIAGAPGFGERKTEAPGAELSEGYKELQGLDYLRRYVPLAHKHGLKVIACFNRHWFPADDTKNLQQWEQVKINGESYGITDSDNENGLAFCVNSNWREWAFSLMEEAVRTGIDGIFMDGPVTSSDCCYCAACQTGFIGAYGRPIPPENWHNPLWKGFLCFKERSLARFIDDARQAINKINPDSVLFLNAGDWEPSSWRAVHNIQQVGTLKDFNGADVVYSQGISSSPYSYLMTGKYLSAGNKPAVVFMQRNNAIQSCQKLPEKEIEMGLAQAASSGISPWITSLQFPSILNGCHGDADRDIIGFIKEKEDYFADCESMAEVGLLFSTYTNRNYLSRWESLYAEACARENGYMSERTQLRSNLKIKCEEMLRHSYTGYFLALTRAHILFDILLDKSLIENGLTRYKTIVLPDAACLDNEAAIALKEFVRRGGNLLCSFEAGHYDAEGDYSSELFDLLGIESVGGLLPVARGESGVWTSDDYPDIKRDALPERATYALKVQAAKGAATLMSFTDSEKASSELLIYPALIINRYGRGQVIYLPEALGHFYGTAGLPGAEDRIANCVNYLTGSPILEVNAPVTVSIEVYRQKKNDRIIIHLVNNTADACLADERFSVAGIDLSLSIYRDPKAVSPLREKGNTSYEITENKLKIHVSSLNLYEVISIDF